MANDRHIFRRGPASVNLLLTFSFLAAILLAINYLTDWLDPLRARVLNWVSPLYQVMDIPQQLREWGDANFASREALLVEVQNLRDQNLILQGRVATMATLAAENTRLRQLLNVAELVEQRVLITEMIGTPPDANAHRLIIDKGAGQGVFVGQPVIDAEGLVGQIAVVAQDYSEVLLITDRSHAVPVQNLRSSVRAIAEGTGENQLRLRYLPVTTDVKAGDLLVTSGLGGTFPKGYPVGEVVSVTVPDGSAYLEVVVDASAKIQTTRHMLLLFSDRQTRSITPEP